jgi:competence protein ComEA
VRALVVLVASCLAVTAWWWWSGRPKEVIAAPVVVATGDPIVAPSASPRSDTVGRSTSEVVVHVAGLVARPGLVTLPGGSRVADAIAAAGGVTRQRASDSVNLARLLVDGEQILVGASPSANAGGPTPASTGPPVIDLNLADAAAFEGLPGVGPVLAGRILEWRSLNGPFRSVDELGEVSGIGEATLSRLRPLVRV